MALISAAIANALAQLSFPRLLIPFIFQMTALVLILHFWLKPERRKLRDLPNAASATPEAAAPSRAR